MKNKSRRETREGKKPYVKPEMKQVQLKPDEAVLGNCKMSGQTEGSFVSGNICEICGLALGS